MQYLRLVRWLGSICAALLLVAWAPLAQAAAPQGITISQPPAQSLRVGDPFSLTVHVPKQDGRVLVNLALVDPKVGANGDLEGWLPNGSTQLVAAGAERTITWEGRAGGVGQFRIYVQAVPLDGTGAVWSSTGTDVQVTSAPVPNSGPLMAVAVGEPLVVVVLVAGFIIGRRRTSLRTGA